MPMTGACTSDIALKVASRGDMPSSMWCSTASTTTMASSTTRPIASTSANSDSVLIEKPEQREEREHADQRDRHRQQRDQRRAPALQEDEDDQHDQADRLEQRDEDLLDARLHRRRGVERDLVVHAGREALLEVAIVARTAAATSSAFEPGQLERGDHARRLAVERRRPGCSSASPSRCVATSRTRTSEPSGFSRTMTSPNSSGVTSRPCARTVYVNCWPGRRRLGADLARRVDHVLRAHRVLDVDDRQAEAREHVGLQPDPHRVVRRAEVADVADAA